MVIRGESGFVAVLSGSHSAPGREREGWGGEREGKKGEEGDPFDHPAAYPLRHRMGSTGMHGEASHSLRAVRGDEQVYVCVCVCV